MKTPEGYVKDDIRKFLDQQGWYYFCPVQTGRGKRTVDILACIPKRVYHLNHTTFTTVGVFVAIEVKRSGKEPTKLQDMIADEIKTSYGVAFWCDSFESFLMTLTAKGFIGQPHQVKNEK